MRLKIGAVRKRLREAPVIAYLAVAGLIVRYAEKPAADVVLSAATNEMPLEAKKRVVHYILRFVGRKAQANQIAQKRFAEFVVERCDLRGAGSPPRKRESQGPRVVAHKILRVALLFLRTGEGTEFPGPQLRFEELPGGLDGEGEPGLRLPG